MITKKESKINGDIYKQRRSISSKIGNEEEENNIDSKKLKSRHRKTASSYFLGSYVSGNELNKFLQDFKEANCENNNSKNKIQNEVDLSNKNNLNIDKKCNICDLKDLLSEKNDNFNQENENNNEDIVCLTNASFYSYSIDDNNEYKNKENEERNILIKGEDDSYKCNEEKKSNLYIENTNNNFLDSNPFYELEKNNEKYSKDKSFIPIKNGLKYIKDKEERVTESYLLALKGGESNRKNGKNPYLLTTSIIEEEKSEFLESTSKKPSIIPGNGFIKEINFKKKNIENELNSVKDIIEKSEDEENKENIDINANKDIKNLNEINKKNSKKEFEINLDKIKMRKNKIIEKKKKCLRKNKENLLNSFYNLSFNRSLPNSQKSKKNEENGSKSNIDNNITNNNRISINKNYLNNNITNFNLVIKDKIHQEFFKNQEKSKTNLNNKKRRTYSYNGGYISYLYNQRFNTEINSNKIKDKIKLNLSKLVHQKTGKNISSDINNNTSKDNAITKKGKLNQTMNKSLLMKIKLNPNMKIPHNKFDKSKAQKISKKIFPCNYNMIKTSKIKKMDKKILLDMSNHRKSLSISKMEIDKIEKHRKIFSSGGLVKKIKPINLIINRSGTFKKERPDSNHIDNKYEKKNYSQILTKRNKQMINSKESLRLPNFTDSSSSRIKQKINYRMINNNENKNPKKILSIRKANSGVLKIKLYSEIENKSEININISNKNQTIIILNDKVKFRNSKEKNDVLDKLKKDFKNNKNSFIILCQRSKINNENEFIFLGLFKYFEIDKRFIKIYGNEEIPNYILLKDINKNNYIIYENKIIKNEENKIQILSEQLNSFYFSFNSIIICKK